MTTITGKRLSSKEIDAAYARAMARIGSLSTRQVGVILRKKSVRRPRGKKSANAVS